MPYQFTKFDGIELPLYNHQQNHDPMPAESTIIDSVGGAWDWFGTARRRGRKQIIPFRGMFTAEQYGLVDDSGNPVVDESMQQIIVAEGVAALRAKVVALLEKRGVRGPLWRKRLDDNVLEWKTARLLQIGWPRKWEDHGLLAELSFQFETYMEGWNAATATASSDSAVAATPLGLTVENAGQIPVDDGVFTVTRTSGTITTVAVTGTGIDWTWTGSLGASDVLTIDAGNQTVKKTGADAYSGFVLGGSHTAQGWLPLAEGDNTLTVTLTGGNGTVAVSHYDQFP